MKKLVLSLIKFYQDHLNFKNPLLRGLFLTDSACRFYPTCSEYTAAAVEKYGLVKGLALGFRRILRCHPFSAGGVDKLP